MPLDGTYSLAPPWLLARQLVTVCAPQAGLSNSRIAKHLQFNASFEVPIEREIIVEYILFNKQNRRWEFP